MNKVGTKQVWKRHSWNRVLINKLQTGRALFVGGVNNE